MATNRDAFFNNEWKQQVQKKNLVNDILVYKSKSQK